MKAIDKSVFHSKPPARILSTLWLAFLMPVLVVACAGTPPQPTPTVLAKELVLYNWVDYMPQSVLDAFEREYGVKVIYHTYDSMDEAVADISSGKVTFDVAVIENDNIADLTRVGRLAQIDHLTVPNLKNISANFRDLAIDPGNKYSIPYDYGTTGLLVRTDLVKKPVLHWSDLWDEQYAGKVAMRSSSRELIGVAAKSLGYPLNTEDPNQLQAVLNRLLSLKEPLQFVEVDPESALQSLTTGNAYILVGWNGDAQIARKLNKEIQYILPAEGTMVWGDSFVISAASPNKHTAEILVNFLLRPEISAQIVQTYFYPTTNDAARSLLPRSIADDPLIFPPPRYLSANDFYQPLSPEGQKRYDGIWQKVATGH